MASNRNTVPAVEKIFIAVLAVVCIVGLVSVLQPSKDPASAVPTVTPVALPPITDQPEAAAAEAARIQVRQQCLINGWARMNELSVGMRDEYARQIKAACGLK